jgi:hypothetical protein
VDWLDSSRWEEEGGLEVWTGGRVVSGGLPGLGGCLHRLRRGRWPLLDQFLVLVLVGDSVGTPDGRHTTGTASDQSGLAFEREELLYRSHDWYVKFDDYEKMKEVEKMIRKTDEQRHRIQVCI